MSYGQEPIRHLDDALRAQHARNRSVCVALSGGMDSVSLLAAFDELARAHNLTLTAVHVNHGLSPRADEWQRFCVALCARRGVEIAIERVEVARDSGLGIEAAARLARYRVLSEQSADFVALAHHLDDQVETFLIQLLRGAGASGLAAMPELRMPWYDGPRLLRPWLRVARSNIEAYARSTGLEWIEDESNDDRALDRNFLRHRVMPLIAERFPAYRGTIARAVRNLADSAALAAELAEEDFRRTECGGGVAVATLRALSPPRALNLLRHLFTRTGTTMPRRVALEEALRQCLQARPDAQVCVSAGDYSLRRYRDAVYLVPAARVPLDWRARWRGDAQLKLPDGLGRLRFRRAAGDGVSAAALSAGDVTVRFRTGGERMALSAKRPHRDLRHLFQDAGVPPWVRERTPLLFCAERMVCVPGIGVAAEFQASEDEPSLLVEWLGSD